MTTDAQSLRPQTAYRSEKKRARTFPGARTRRPAHEADGDGTATPNYYF
jgi:hypothetical protein